MAVTAKKKVKKKVTAKGVAGILKGDNNKSKRRAANDKMIGKLKGKKSPLAAKASKGLPEEKKRTVVAKKKAPSKRTTVARKAPATMNPTSTSVAARLKKAGVKMTPAQLKVLKETFASGGVPKK